MGSHVCDLCDGNSGPGRSLAFITTTGAITCLTNNRNLRTRCHPGGRCYPIEPLPRPTYFPAGLAMGVAFLFWGLITTWVVLLVGVALFIAALAGWITEIRHEYKAPLSRRLRR